MITLRNNSPGVLAIPFRNNSGRQELRLKPGWNSVQPGALDMVTGGLDKNGRAKGGLAARYFNDVLKVDDGKRMAPILEVGQPLAGETVHDVKPVRGARSHYRTRRRQEEQGKVAALQAQVARLTALVESGGQVTVPIPAAPPFDPGAHTISELDDMLEGISAADAKAVLMVEVLGKNRAGAVEAIKFAMQVAEA